MTNRIRLPFSACPYLRATFHLVGRLRHEGGELAASDDMATNAKGSPELYAVQRAFVIPAAQLGFWGSHHELATRNHHHFGAVFVVLEPFRLACAHLEPSIPSAVNDPSVDPARTATHPTQNGVSRSGGLLPNSTCTGRPTEFPAMARKSRASIVFAESAIRSDRFRAIKP
jgi:hypothetical protein